MLSPLVRQLCTLIEERPETRLVVFVPRPQLGFALRDAVVLERGETAGVVPTTPITYAKDLAELSLRAKGKTELTTGTRFFLTSSAVQQLSARTRRVLSGDQPLSGMVGPLARTFHVLRMHHIDADTYRTRAAETDRQRARGDAFAAYEALVEQNNYYDGAILLSTAARMVDNGVVDLSATRWAILNTVSITPLARSFIETLQREAAIQPGLSLLGPALASYSEHRERAQAPPTVAGTHFPDAPTPSPSEPSDVGRVALVPGTSMRPETANRLRFWTATGIRREVQSVFEDIVDQDHSLDTVEIAYTSPTPYLPLIDTLAERYELPVSLSSGRAIAATRPGQTLKGFLDWIASGCTIPDLIELFRSGRLHLPSGRTADETGDGRLNFRDAATLLAETRYPDDPAEYEKTFAAWMDRITKEIETLVEDGGDESWVEERIEGLRKKRAAVGQLAEVVEDLLRLACSKRPASVRPKELATGAETLLKKYGPTEKPTREKDQRTPDEVARNRLLERLARLSEQNGRSSHPPRQLAGLLKTWMGLSPFVRAQRPQPGRAHVVPLESAGYADRDHLYVVGLDAASTGSSVPTDPLLSDNERESLSDEKRSLPLHADQADAESWRIRQAIARHAGTITFLASTYDVTEDEDLFQAPLYLRLKDTAQTVRDVPGDEADSHVTHHPLSSDWDTVLSDLDRWTSRHQPDRANVRSTINAQFPWLRHGLDAREARASEAYTSYDGLLARGTYENLDPIRQARPVTAGRLEAYAKGPFAYFLRYVLDISPLDEPALDDVAWLDAMDRGAVLHKTFQRFMSDLVRQPTPNDEDRLRKHFDDTIDEFRSLLPPPSEVVFATTRRRLWNDALLFLREESTRAESFTPVAFERGFGYPPHRRSDDDFDDAPTLTLGPCSFSLRGRIDRIDRRPDGSLSIWDYKTGSSRTYDETDLLDEARHLQWALYAYALEALERTSVASSGYFFTSTDEMGKRISAVPSAHRRDVTRLVQQISEGISAGAFPVTDADDLKYSFGALFHNFSNRRKELTSKDWPNGRPAPPSMRDE